MRYTELFHYGHHIVWDIFVCPSAFAHSALRLVCSQETEKGGEGGEEKRKKGRPVICKYEHITTANLGNSGGLEFLKGNDSSSLEPSLFFSILACD